MSDQVSRPTARDEQPRIESRGSIIAKDSPLVRVLEYKPKKFELGVPQQAMEFQEIRKRKANDFRMSETLRIQTGLDKLDAQDTENEVEKRTLEKLKSVQEGAYQAAYELGLQEGRKQAFVQSTAAIDSSLAAFATLMQTIENLKSELLKQNESHLIKLAIQMATRLAHHEVEVNNQCVVNIMRQAIADAQLDEQLTVQVSAAQFEFLETLKKENGRQYDFLKRIKLDPSEAIRPGGCVIETNYGVIDARIDERVGKLWETMTENLYRIKDQIGAA